MFIDTSPWSPSLDTDVRLRFTLCVCGQGGVMHVSMLTVWRSKQFLSSAVAVFCQADFSRHADLWAFVQFSSLVYPISHSARTTDAGHWIDSLCVCMCLFSGCRSPGWSGTSCVARMASAHRDLPCAFWVLGLTVLMGLHRISCIRLSMWFSGLEFPILQDRCWLQIESERTNWVWANSSELKSYWVTLLIIVN